MQNRKQLQLDDVEDGDLTDISKESECVDDDAKTIVAEFDYQRKNYFIRWFENYVVFVIMNL